MKALIIDLPMLFKYNGATSDFSNLVASSSNIEWSNNYFEYMNSITNKARGIHVIDNLKDSSSIINENIEFFKDNYITLFTDYYKDLETEFDKNDNIMLNNQNIIHYYNKYMNMHTSIINSFNNIDYKYDIIILSKSKDNIMKSNMDNYGANLYKYTNNTKDDAVI